MYISYLLKSHTYVTLYNLATAAFYVKEKKFRTVKGKKKFFRTRLIS